MTSFPRFTTEHPGELHWHGSGWHLSLPGSTRAYWEAGDVSIDLSGRSVAPFCEMLAPLFEPNSRSRPTETFRDLTSWCYLDPNVNVNILGAVNQERRTFEFTLTTRRHPELAPRTPPQGLSPQCTLRGDADDWKALKQAISGAQRLMDAEMERHNTLIALAQKVRHSGGVACPDAKPWTFARVRDLLIGWSEPSSSGNATSGTLLVWAPQDGWIKLDEHFEWQPTRRPALGPLRKQWRAISTHAAGLELSGRIHQEWGDFEQAQHKALALRARLRLQAERISAIQTTKHQTIADQTGADQTAASPRSHRWAGRFAEGVIARGEGADIVAGGAQWRVERADKLTICWRQPLPGEHEAEPGLLCWSPGSGWLGRQGGVWAPSAAPSTLVRSLQRHGPILSKRAMTFDGQLYDIQKQAQLIWTEL